MQIEYFTMFILSLFFHRVFVTPISVVVWNDLAIYQKDVAV